MGVDEYSVDQRVLRWFGHLERMDEYRMVTRVLMAEVSGGRVALNKLFKCDGGAGAEGALFICGHLQLISTLKIGADCCQLCQHKLT